MKNLGKTLIALGLLLILSVAMLNMPTLEFGQKATSDASKTRIWDPNLFSIAGNQEFDIEISNITITEEIVVANDSYVMIENAHLESGTRITVRDSAYVLMQNINTSYARIYARDNATIKLINFNAERLQITISTNATLILEDSIIGITTYTSYITSHGSLIMNNSVMIKENIYLEEGYVGIFDSVFNETKIYIRDSTIFDINNSGNFSTR